MAKKSKLEKIYKVDYEDGYYLFKLNSILDSRQVSKNSIIEKKNIDFNSVQRLIKGELSRVDLGVIAKLCNEFHCHIEDIVEYINNDDIK